MKRALLAVAAAAALGGCGGPSAVLLHLTTSPANPLTPGTDFSTLVISVSGQTSVLATTTKEMQIGATFPQTLTLLPGDQTQSAQIVVDVKAEDVNGGVVSEKLGQTTFVPGKIVDLTIELPGP